MRSTFDSEVNYNRTLAHGTWSTSESVFLTLQAMSAACLADVMPSARVLLPSLAHQAVHSVQGEINRLHSSQSLEVTVDLLFAVFSLGTSLHWTGAAITAHAWLSDARDLLSRWTSTVTPIHAMVQAHFRQALTYWEMCVTAAGHGSIAAQIDRSRQQYYERMRQDLSAPDQHEEKLPTISLPDSSWITPWSTRPNSWCGVSEEIIHYFGQVLALCRHAKASTLASAATPSIQIFCDTLIAQQLQLDLLSLDFNDMVLGEEAQGFFVQTEDSRTPLSHLTDTAEAYRQAALLQLYMAFDDLMICPSLDGIEIIHGHPVERMELLRKKALELVAILASIPIESGAATMHPILYISAAAALKDAVISEKDICREDRPVITAKGLILERLQALQKMLPHNTSGGMLHVVNSMWSGCKYGAQSSMNAFWMGLMADEGFGVILR